ncbi:enoyl-CoA hydratase/isomerase family protein [Flavobacterium sp. NRK F10]|uniref:Enoyl-CoA hydratase n=1 Tax=Flavobacterium sediminis TaxID=2201181 RepID=A0A2U8QTB2_9FLAO|nr:MULTISPECIES: enoyl-CoA hydratase/isomerase family protein [Flavobacterium]AWM13402.1 enoyl-CoA hydratase [Flavobacterium sediminis]MCO6174519.1 enoyl-CoA hydratase/isomerase family protein [Flavobacterium sp. NRK F10]
MDAFVKTAINTKIATITFYNKAGNSLPGDLLNQLAQSFYNLGKDNSVQLIVLKSEGETTFCAGASFDELLSISNFEEGTKFFSGFAHVINAMRKCEKIIVGEVQGKAVGGGVGLIAACDYVFASVNASVKLSELAIGIGPFVIEPAVSRKIGKTGVGEMALQPTQWKDAHWAKENGLFNRVFDSNEEMRTALKSYTEELSEYNPEALVELKKVLWEGIDDWDHLLFERAAISGRLVLSDFTKKALSKFKSK